MSDMEIISITLWFALNMTYNVFLLQLSALV